MAQLSLRLDDDLHRRARAAAKSHGTSLNSFISRVLRIAIEPSADEPLADQIRARFAAAGLIASPQRPVDGLTLAEREAFEDARSRSGGPTLASELISAERAQR